MNLIVSSSAIRGARAGWRSRVVGLLCGGLFAAAAAPSLPLAAAELPAQPLPSARLQPVAGLLPDGRVLVAGGFHETLGTLASARRWPGLRLRDATRLPPPACYAGRRSSWKMRRRGSIARKSCAARANEMFSRVPRHRKPRRTRLSRNSSSTWFCSGSVK